MTSILTRAAAGLLALAASAAQALTFQVTDIGSLPGSTGTTQAAAINAHGVVTGAAMAADGSTQAFRYEQGRMTALGTLGGLNSAGRGINAHGVVVGLADLTGSAGQDAFAADARRMRDLGTLGGSLSVAVGVTDRGVIAGNSQTADGRIHAFRWRRGVMRDLGTLGGAISSARGINNHWVVVGTSLTASNASHAFVHAHGVMTDINGSAVSSDAYAVNDDGVVVGSMQAQVGQSAHAFSYRLADGTMSDLGDPLGGGAYALAVNGAGDVVGCAVGSDFVTLRAYGWSAGAATDLNGLLDPVSGWGVQLQCAVGVNDRGQVVATGVRAGDATLRSFLLTPI